MLQYEIKAKRNKIQSQRRYANMLKKRTLYKWLKAMSVIAFTALAVVGACG